MFTSVCLHSLANGPSWIHRCSLPTAQKMALWYPGISNRDTIETLDGLMVSRTHLNCFPWPLWISAVSPVGCLLSFAILDWVGWGGGGQW